MFFVKLSNYHFQTMKDAGFLVFLLYLIQVTKQNIKGLLYFDILKSFFLKWLILNNYRLLPIFKRDGKMWLRQQLVDINSLLYKYKHIHAFMQIQEEKAGRAHKHVRNESAFFSFDQKSIKLQCVVYSDYCSTKAIQHMNRGIQKF